ncbi:hypothetical protein ACOMHN_065109 [Nucella lapillus]
MCFTIKWFFGLKAESFIVNPLYPWHCNAVLGALEQGEFFFLDAPGGTDKTFLINLLLSKVRQRGDIAIAVASSGIAATLLTGGRTAHSTFKLPLNLAQQETPSCNIHKNTDEANVLKQPKLIVWDECTMAHKNALQALNMALQDICDSPKLFGGVTLLLAGGFRQTLPIITGGTPADELDACLKSSHLWGGVSTLHLNTNMRVRFEGDHSSETFSNQLLEIGNGNMPFIDGYISILNEFANIVPNVEGLKQKVYPNLHENLKNHDWLAERAILAPRNDIVGTINSELLAQMSGDTVKYTSVDSVLEDTDSLNYPTEFLNSLEPPGMPPHTLNLKEGYPVMLLRNLDAPKLCNGTRTVVKHMHPHVVEATIMTGKHKPLIPSDVPLSFKRLQPPLKLCFSMSINKSQGQSLKAVGIHLQDRIPAFPSGNSLQ